MFVYTDFWVLKIFVSNEERIALQEKIPERESRSGNFRQVREDICDAVRVVSVSGYFTPCWAYKKMVHRLLQVADEDTYLYSRLKFNLSLLAGLKKNTKIHVVW
jgi:hypothetical protein